MGLLLELQDIPPQPSRLAKAEAARASPRKFRHAFGRCAAGAGTCSSRPRAHVLVSFSIFSVSVLTPPHCSRKRRRRSAGALWARVPGLRRFTRGRGAVSAASCGGTAALRSMAAARRDAATTACGEDGGGGVRWQRRSSVGGGQPRHRMPRRAGRAGRWFCVE